VLEHVREGQTNAEIAVRLGLSPDGVKFHVSNMLSKLELPDRQALAAWQPSRRPRFAPKMHLGLPGLVGAFKAISLKGGLAIAGGALVVAAGLGGAFALRSVRSNADKSNGVPDVGATMNVTSFALTETQMQSQQITGSGTTSINRYELSVSYRAPDQSRKEISVVAGAARSAVVNQLITGDTLFMWSPGSGQLTSVKGGASANEPYAGKTAGWPVGASDLRSLTIQLAPFSDGELMGEGQVAGRPVYIINLSASRCTTGQPTDGPMTVWIDKETLFVLKQEQRSADGRVVSTSEVTEIAYNGPLSDSVFEPPEHGVILETQDLAQGARMTVYRMAGVGSAVQPQSDQFAALTFQSVGGAITPGAGPQCPRHAGTVVQQSANADGTGMLVPAVTTATPAASAAVGP
jgi:outer membrane lipoprotein-sorting protein